MEFSEKKRGANTLLVYNVINIENSVNKENDSEQEEFLQDIEDAIWSRTVVVATDTAMEKNLLTIHWIITNLHNYI